MQQQQQPPPSFSFGLSFLAINWPANQPRLGSFGRVEYTTVSSRLLLTSSSSSAAAASGFPLAAAVAAGPFATWTASDQPSSRWRSIILPNCIITYWFPGTSCFITWLSKRNIDRGETGRPGIREIGQHRRPTPTKLGTNFITTVLSRIYHQNIFENSFIILVYFSNSSRLLAILHLMAKLCPNLFWCLFPEPASIKPLLRQASSDLLPGCYGGY